MEPSNEPSGERDTQSQRVGTLPILSVAALVIGVGLPTVMFTNTETIDYRKRGHVSFEHVEPIVQDRCVPCHAENPTHETFDEPPASVTLESPANVKKHADRIMVRTVKEKTMPMNNETGMTAEERETIGAWIYQGAELEQTAREKTSMSDGPQPP